jgi:hypothetical protein
MPPKPIAPVRKRKNPATETATETATDDTVLTKLFDHVAAEAAMPDYVFWIIPFRDACYAMPRNMWKSSIPHRMRCKADSTFFAGTVFADTIKSTAKTAADMAKTAAEKARETALASKLTPTNVSRLLHSPFFFTCCDEFCTKPDATTATTEVFCKGCWNHPRNKLTRPSCSSINVCKDFAVIWHHVVHKDPGLVDLKV